MRKLRVAAAATVIALTAAFVSAGGANAASGVGTTETKSSLLDVALGTTGSLLHLRVLGDDSKTTLDPKVGPVSALSQMSVVDLTSSVLPVLNNLHIPSVPFKAQATGTKTSDSASPSVDIGNVIGQLGGNLPLLGSVLGGVLAPGQMSASITDGVAKSTMKLNLTNLNLVGGLLKLTAVGSDLTSAATGTQADAGRTMKVDAISVLNLGSLLRGLGIDPANLVISQVSGLLSGLQIPIAGIPAGTSLDSFVTDLLTTVTGLTGQTGAFSALPSGVQSTVNGALGGLGGVPVIGGLLNGSNSVIPTTDVGSLLSTVTGLLDSVLPTALNLLDQVDLLKLNGLELGAVAHAVNGTKDSNADVITKIGALSVGGINLGAVDLGATLSTVTGLLNTVTDTVDGVLGGLGLDGLLTFKLFDKYADNGVSSSNGYTKALAGIAGLNVGIDPSKITNILGVVGALNNPASNNSVLSIGETIAGLTGNTAADVPVVGGLMNTLNGALGGTNLLGALLGGASIKVADVSTGTNFTAPGSVAQATPVTQLPRTGANTTAFLVIGLLMVGGVVVGRRYIPVRVSNDS